jgi:hypothetical protein
MLTIDAIESLSATEREFLRKHIQLSGSIMRIIAIQNFLIEEVHAKRAVEKRGKFMPTDPKIEKLYSTILFGGRKRVTSFDAFPSEFKCQLDMMLFREVTRKQVSEIEAKLKFKLIDVYYGTIRVEVEEMRVDKAFDTAEWEFSESGNDDEAILLRYRDEFIVLMRHLAATMKEGGLKVKELAGTKKEIRRYCRKNGVQL